MGSIHRSPYDANSLDVFMTMLKSPFGAVRRLGAFNAAVLCGSARSRDIILRTSTQLSALQLFLQDQDAMVARLTASAVQACGWSEFMPLSLRELAWSTICCHWVYTQDMVLPMELDAMRQTPPSGLQPRFN